MTEAQKRDAYHEAKHILRKWQQLMPGTRKPNFKRAAREILRRALGRKVRRNDAPLNLHGGLMHEHDEREAHLLERTLKSGHHDPTPSRVPASPARARCHACRVRPRPRLARL